MANNVLRRFVHWVKSISDSLPVDKKIRRSSKLDWWLSVNCSGHNKVLFAFLWGDGILLASLNN